MEFLIVVVILFILFVGGICLFFGLVSQIFCKNLPPDSLRIKLARIGAGMIAVAFIGLLLWSHIFE